jgi:hypothetical protein
MVQDCLENIINHFGINYTMISLLVFYTVGTLVGFWLSRSFWMMRGAAKCYEIMCRKREENERW